MDKLKSSLFRQWLGPEGYVQEIAALPSGHLIPDTTNKTVVIPYDYNLNEFDVVRYSKSQADNKIKINDIREFVEPIEQLIKETFRGLRPFTIPDWFLFLCVTFGYEVVMIICIANLTENNFWRAVLITLLTLLLML